MGDPDSQLREIERSQWQFERAAFTGSALAGLGGSLLGSFLFWAQELGGYSGN